MKQIRIKHLRIILLLVLFLFIISCRLIPSVAEWYALHLYPIVASFLSNIASLFSFSLEELTIICLFLGLFIKFSIDRFYKHSPWKKVLLHSGEYVLWIYIWFYIGWGINYFRQPFFERTDINPVEYNEKDFKQFLSVYTTNLNASYTISHNLSSNAIERNIQTLYSVLPAKYGLQRPNKHCTPKKVLFNSLYSQVGVLGYMGPFFNETQLNQELLPTQYPFTYAHELSHLLGISSEAEANFWAYQICTNSSIPEIQYSGYFGLMPYIVVNAQGLLNEEEYKNWVKSIRTEIVEDFNVKNEYWGKRYNPFIGIVQDKIYDWFLKGNNITSGKKNYAEVVNMLISFQKAQHHP